MPFFPSSFCFSILRSILNTSIYTFYSVYSLSIPSDVTWRRRWHPTPVLLPGKSHGWRSLVGCSPWGHKESDTTERPHFHFSLSCTAEGNGNPLHCSCLENLRDGEPGGLPSLCNPIDSSPPGSPSLRFSRQEHWNGLPFPSPVYES